MKKEDELLKELTDMVKETKKGQIKWKLSCQTTEYNDEAVKPTVTEDGITWTVDECYVSYECTYKGSDFVMITYEMIHTAGDNVGCIVAPPHSGDIVGLRRLASDTLISAHCFHTQCRHPIFSPTRFTRCGYYCLRCIRATTQA